MEFADYLATHRPRVDATLESLLPPVEGPAATVAAAMRYAVLGGGKRLRPIVAIAACEACGGPTRSILEPACALELVHAYSLVHDDLPAMDDDDLRRGRPTVHREYGEATAILAGDALLTLAFEVLGAYPQGADVAARRAAAVVAVASGAGVGGMVGGQLADLEAERQAVDLERLRWIHRHKTGALFASSCVLGAIVAGARDEHLGSLRRFGYTVGLAFQIADDLLDRSGTREALGKTPGKDQRAGKATYPALLGEEAARREAEERVREAVEELHREGPASGVLEALAQFAVRRTR